MRFLLLAIMILSSCATKKYEKIEPEFTDYVDSFIQYSNGTLTSNDINNLTVTWYKSKNTAVGLCNYLTNTINIDKKYWYSMDQWGREELILHELGHCVLKRYHTNPKNNPFHDAIINLGLVDNIGYLRDGCPTSLMHPYVLGGSCFWKHYTYYIDELFKRTDKAEYNVIPWR